EHGVHERLRLSRVAPLEQVAGFHLVLHLEALGARWVGDDVAPRDRGLDRTGAYLLGWNLRYIPGNGGCRGGGYRVCRCGDGLRPRNRRDARQHDPQGHSPPKTPHRATSKFARAVGRTWTCPLPSAPTGIDLSQAATRLGLVSKALARRGDGGRMTTSPTRP